MASITISDLKGPQDLDPEKAAMVKGGPLEIRELNIKATIAPDTATREK